MTAQDAKWNPDALAAFDAAGLSRRDFLKGTGALIVGFSTLGGAVQVAAEVQGINGAGSNDLDAWVAIRADGNVTAYTGKCELGHGLYTAQTQLIAEELGVAFDRVRLIQCDTALTPDQGTTSGAQSHPANFNHANLALAAATAREALLERAAGELGVSVESLEIDNGVIRVASDPQRQIGYGALIGGEAFAMPLNPAAQRMHPSTWDHPGPVRAACGDPRHRDRTVRVCSQRARGGNVTRTGRAASRRWSDPAQRG